MSDADINVIFEVVIDSYLVFTCRFHADMLTDVLEKPPFELDEIMIECGKGFVKVSRNVVRICFYNSSNKEVFVDVDTTTDWINQFH